MSIVDLFKMVDDLRECKKEYSRCVNLYDYNKNQGFPTDLIECSMDVAREKLSTAFDSLVKEIPSLKKQKDMYMLNFTI